jgi:hypothetical protein
VFILSFTRLHTPWEVTIDENYITQSINRNIAIDDNTCLAPTHNALENHRYLSSLHQSGENIAQHSGSSPRIIGSPHALPTLKLRIYIHISTTNPRTHSNHKLTSFFPFTTTSSSATRLPPSVSTYAMGASPMTFRYTSPTVLPLFTSTQSLNTAVELALPDVKV